MRTPSVGKCVWRQHSTDCYLGYQLARPLRKATCRYVAMDFNPAILIQAIIFPAQITQNAENILCACKDVCPIIIK